MKSYSGTYQLHLRQNQSLLNVEGAGTTGADHDDDDDEAQLLERTFRIGYLKSAVSKAAGVEFL